MANVESITKLPIGDNSATIKFDNGYQLLVRIVDEYENRTIVLTPNKKLVVINADLSCKVLLEGVSVR